MNRRSIADGLQPPGPRQLSPTERAFKETGTIPENIRVYAQLAAFAVCQRWV